MYEIKEEDATGHIALIYSDLRKSLNIKVVNTIWRYLATIDGGLEWVWNSSKTLYMSGKLEKVQPKIIENIQTQKLLRITDDILKSINITKEDKLEIIQITEKYNKGNSMNVIGLSSFLKAYDKKILSRGNILLKIKAPLNISGSFSQETLTDINSLTEIFVNTNEYIPFPPGLYIELARWPSFLSLILEMFSGLDKTLFQNDIQSLNKKTETFIEPFLNEIIIKSNPQNKDEINIPIHNLVTVAIPKMLLIGKILKKSLS